MNTGSGTQTVIKRNTGDSPGRNIGWFTVAVRRVVAMSDQYILSIDPGLSSGVALGRVPEGKPYELVKAWQASGGLAGVVGWLDDLCAKQNDEWPWTAMVDGRLMYLEEEMTIIAEKFTPLQGTGFNLTMKAVEPLRIEGALVALDVMPDYPDPRWRRPQEMYSYGGNSLKEKKALGRKFLKDNGMYVTGKTVGQPDADDARSAIWHGISYAAKVLKSKETFQMIADWSESNEGKLK